MEAIERQSIIRCCKARKLFTNVRITGSRIHEVGELAIGYSTLHKPKTMRRFYGGMKKQTTACLEPYERQKTDYLLL